MGAAGFAGANTFGGWTAAAVLPGIGTAAVYPTLIAQASDLVAPLDPAPSWWASIASDGILDTSLAQSSPGSLPISSGSARRLRSSPASPR